MVINAAPVTSASATISRSNGSRVHVSAAAVSTSGVERHVRPFEPDASPEVGDDVGATDGQATDLVEVGQLELHHRGDDRHVLVDQRAMRPGRVARLSPA